MGPNTVHYSITVKKQDKSYRLWLADKPNNSRQNSATLPNVTHLLLFIEAGHK
jgi:hypothetical protein